MRFLNTFDVPAFASIDFGALASLSRLNTSLVRLLGFLRYY